MYVNGRVINKPFTNYPKLEHQSCLFLQRLMRVFLFFLLNFAGDFANLTTQLTYESNPFHKPHKTPVVFPL